MLDFRFSQPQWMLLLLKHFTFALPTLPLSCHQQRMHLSRVLVLAVVVVAFAMILGVQGQGKLHRNCIDLRSWIVCIGPTDCW